MVLTIIDTVYDYPGSYCVRVAYLPAHYWISSAAITMVSPAASCAKCHETIKAAAYFRCHGLCGGSFHINYTSSSQQHMRSVQDVPNLFWCCDGCVVVMNTPEYKTAFRALCEVFRNVSETHAKAIEEVKTELAETNSKIDQLVSKLPDPMAYLAIGQKTA